MMQAQFISVFAVIVIVAFEILHAAQHVLILTGRPGCGKTSSVHKIIELLKNERISVDGYITNSLRKGVSRVGFEVINIKTLDRATFASIAYTFTGKDGPRIGNFIIDVPAFDSIIKPIFTNLVDGPKVLIMDEVGRMESTSSYFSQSVSRLLNDDSCIILGVCTSKGAFLEAFPNVTNENDIYFFSILQYNKSATPSAVARILAEMYRKRLSGPAHVGNNISSNA